MTVMEDDTVAEKIPATISSVIKGVVIRPNGDVSERHLSRFVDKYILPTDPIFADVVPTELSVQLEFPLVVTRLYPRESIPGDQYHKNRPATFLNIRPCSGFAPLDWQRKIGCVLVVRMDRKPLNCLHLEAMWRYAWTLLSEVNSIGYGWDKGPKRRASRTSF